MGYSKNIVSTLIVRLITLVLGFVTSIALARALGPSVRGELSYFLLVFNTIAEYAPIAILHSVPYFLKRTSYCEKHVLSVDFLFLLLVISVIFSGIFFGSITGLFLTEYSLVQLMIGFVFSALHMFSKLLTLYLMANDRIIEMNKIFLITNLAQQFSVLLLWFFGFLGFPIYILLLLISAVVNLFLTSRCVKLRIVPRKDFGLLRKQFNYGIFVYLGALFGSLFYRVDQFMIKNLSGFSELGIYVIAVIIAERVFLIPESITGPLTGRLYNSQDSATRRLTVESTVRVVLLITIVISLIGVLLRNMIPILFGEEYAGATIPFVIVLLGTIGASIGKCSYPFFLFIGRPWIHTIVTGISLTVNVGINIMLIPSMGIFGAAVATLISYSLYGALYILFLWKYGHNLRQMLIVQKSDLSMFWKKCSTIIGGSRHGRRKDN